MWWIIFAVWMVLGLIANVSMAAEKNAETEEEKKRASIGWKVVLIIGVTILSIGLLFVVGWIWYYICGGGLLFLDTGESFFWKAIWGLATLIPLAFVIGFIAILCGWDPRD